MLRFKFVRYFLVLLPFILTLASPISEPLKNYVFNPYELRWYSPDAAKDRIQEVSVYNGGSAELPKVLVELTVQSNSTGPVSDFYFSALDSSPQVSFFDTLASANSTASLFTRDKNRILPIFDSHSRNRDLFTLDQELDHVLVSDLEKKPFADILAELRKTTGECSAWHDLWLQKCVNSSDPICDQVSSILGVWENEKREVQSEATSKWQSATGVSAWLPGDRLSPGGKTFFVFPLGAKESGKLGVKYSIARVELGEIKVSSTMGGEAVRVAAFKDLKASPLWIIAKEHPWLTIPLAIALLLSLWVAWEAVKPNKLRPIQQIVNLALRHNDHEFWELAYQRHRYFILQEFRSLRETLNRDAPQLDDNEVLDFIRERLTTKYEQDKKEYRNHDKLNDFIREHLRFLVLPIQEVFNLALRNNDHESWQLADRRHRYFITQEFDRFREVFNKNILQLGKNEIWDFVKESLRTKYRHDRLEYGSLDELNSFIRNQLRFLVLYS